MDTEAAFANALALASAILKDLLGGINNYAGEVSTKPMYTASVYSELKPKTPRNRCSLPTVMHIHEAHRPAQA